MAYTVIFIFKNSFHRSGGKCEDLNECTAGYEMCDTNAECINFPGSVRCSCKSGWRGDGEECMDINECDAKTDNCPQGQVYTLTHVKLKFK